MWNVFVICLSILTKVHSLDENSLQPDSDNNIPWMWFPDGNGTPQKMYMAYDPSSSGQARTFGPRNVPENVNFILYRKSGRVNVNHREGKSFEDDDDEIPGLENFDASLPTKIIIHGWMSSERSSTVQDIKENYLLVNDMNVFAVDWQYIAGNAFYFTPAAQTRQVGEFTAELIDYLVKHKDANLSTFHLIGHSLGGHTVGYAGSFVKSGRIPRITGLDPALPGFEPLGPDSRLDTSDADFVDIIHTCAGLLGYLEPIGHVDFFPNGGTSQPGCSQGKDVLGIACSHGRSHEYFAESILSDVGFQSYNCPNGQLDYKLDNCDKENPVLMGDPTPDTSRGKYYLNTNSEPPFAMASNP